jgi:hypothetical protein
METYAWWTRLQLPGLEQLHLTENEMGAIADSLMLGIADATPFRLWYQLRVDRAWKVRECLLQVGGEQGQALHLLTDGQGHWSDAAGVPCSTLDGCLDLDISHTPFTNTLPLRRLALAPGESADLLVAYISISELSIHPVRQRYTCLSRTPSGGTYRYEGVDSHFTADLLVDEQALVVDYPGIWKRAEMSWLGAGIPKPSSAALEGLLAFGPHPDEASNLQLFGQFVGDWDADWTGYQPERGVSQTGKGEIHFAWVLDGRAIQDVWIFPTRAELRRGLPMDEWGSTLRFYDPSLGTWKISFQSPVNRVVRTMTARPVGDEIWIEGPNLKGQPLRWIFSQITSHSFHWSNFVSEDGEQTWRLQEELEAHRVG